MAGGKFILLPGGKRFLIPGGKTRLSRSDVTPPEDCYGPCCCWQIPKHCDTGLEFPGGVIRCVTSPLTFRAYGSCWHADPTDPKLGAIPTGFSVIDTSDVFPDCGSCTPTIPSGPCHWCPDGATVTVASSWAPGDASYSDDCGDSCWIAHQYSQAGPVSFIYNNPPASPDGCVGGSSATGYASCDSATFTTQLAPGGTLAGGGCCGELDLGGGSAWDSSPPPPSACHATGNLFGATIRCSYGPCNFMDPGQTIATVTMDYVKCWDPVAGACVDGVPDDTGECNPLP